MAEPVVHRNTAVIWDVVNGATTLCHTEKAEFFTVNHTGAAIWDACEGHTVDQIVAEIRVRYPEADETQAAMLVRHYIDLLEKEGLVERRADDSPRRRGGR